MPSAKNKPARPVSANNPCPFLRALVAQGQVPDGQSALGDLADTIVAVARTGDGEPRLPAAAIRAIALVANGLGPLKLGRSALAGVRLDALRDGPLDKRGAGSGILDAQAKVNRAELDRLDQFAADYADAEGRTERGLGAPEIERMMDANFERAAGRRRRIDRRLMDGEWPVLLKVMGKQGRTARYLGIGELRELFLERRLPARMLARMPAA